MRGGGIVRSGRDMYVRLDVRESADYFLPQWRHRQDLKVFR